jgi:hypothetical protein
MRRHSLFGHRPPMGDQITVNEAQALHAYIISVQWKAFNEREQQKAPSGEVPSK